MTSSAVFFHGTSSSRASSPPLTHPWAYHVFLSFRGEDTRNTFIAHLYDALNRGGINTYIDNELKRGEEISPALLKAIEGSRISIIVFSENYAESKWCLDELMKIVECKETRQQTILPVFYHVDPSDVRNQRKSFRDALAKLEDRFKDDKDKVQRWKVALTEVANLSGHHLSNGNEAEFIHEIVQYVSRIVNTTQLDVTEHPVGIDTRVQDIMKFLCVGMEDVRMVGILGAGGIGKTTIVKAIYNLIAHQFEASCFLVNVRERSNREGGLVQLQEELLCEILGNSKSLKVGIVDRGITMIKDRLSSRRVLLILDDVDQLDHLKKLAGGHHWFGLGSRIIITTRDQRVLTSYEVDSMYKMKGLEKMEALQLFSWHAFKRDKPIVEYEKLTEDIIHYAGGLPLALEVLGSDLKDRSIDEWRSALNEFKKAPHDTIQKILRISFDGLGKNEKDIFLDIACFFKGGERNYIGEILDGCGFSSVIGIKKLVEKCLITIDHYEQRVGMHDLVQDMGKEVVRQESHKEPERCSRLWFYEDVRYVLEENMGTNKIEGINLLASPEEDIISLHPEAFEKMKKLRVFISRKAHFRRELNYLSNELRVLDCDHYPSHFLPPNFDGKKLIVFRMHNSLIKELGGGGFKNLTFMELSCCNEIEEIPDLSSSSNLKELIIFGCSNLVEVHQSVGSLDKLVNLHCWDCRELQSFPKRLKLRSLEKLQIINCQSLQHFPEIECEMEKVLYLQLDGTGINELPSSIVKLTRLKNLSLYRCKSLSLPRSIFQFKALEDMHLYDCPKSKLFGIDGHNGRALAFPSLKILSLDRCGLSHSDLFTTLFNCSEPGPEKLFLRETNIRRLPSSMVRFVQLRHLDLDNCEELLEIPELPPNIKEITARGCTSLERFSQLPKILWQFNESGLQALENVDLTGCHKLQSSVPKTSMFQGYPTRHYESYRGRAFAAVFPGSTKPNSLHPCKENSGVFEIDIGALRNSDKIIGGIALYVVFGPSYGKSYLDVDNNFIGGIKVDCSSGRNSGLYRVFTTRNYWRSNHMLVSVLSDHVLLVYISAYNIECHNIEHVQASNDSDLLAIKYCGFYPVYMNDEEEAAKDTSEMLCDGVDSNLESHWERKRKYSSTFGTQISSLEDGNDDAREELASEV